MPDMFGFDAKTLSNDELFSRQLDLTSKKVMAARLGRMDTIIQLENMIRAIDNERQERMFLDRIKNMPAAGVVIETDPSLQRAESPPEESNVVKNMPTGRPVRRTVRTSAPVTPNDGI